VGVVLRADQLGLHGLVLGVREEPLVPEKEKSFEGREDLGEV
jgi:hypothetical protein